MNFCPRFKLISIFQINSLLFLSLCLSSCVKDELHNLSGNIVLDQNFSIPIGAVDLRTSLPVTPDTSGIPGPFGTYWYNGLPYPIRFTNFPLVSAVVDLNFSKKTNSTSIKNLNFIITSENSYPTQVSLQVELLDGSNNSLDKIFGDNVLIVGGAKINSAGDIISPTTNITSIPFDESGIQLLMQTKKLRYTVVVYAINPPIILSDKNKFRVSIGVQAQLVYNAQDL